MTIIRCNADGSRDTAFGAGGTFPNLGRFGSGTSVVIQPDGKIVVLGSSQGSFTSPALLTIFRFNSNGLLDTTFDADGIVTTNGMQGYSIAVQADGKLIAAGDTGVDFALLRYNADGSPDTTFDGDGRVITNIAGTDKATSVAVQTDGKIVAVGESSGAFRDRPI